jgi:hypothetical protein
MLIPTGIVKETQDRQRLRTEALAASPSPENCLFSGSVSCYNSRPEAERKNVMKKRLFLLSFVSFAVLMHLAGSARAQTIVTFDNLPNSTTGTFIASPYQGLSWSNFGVVNAILMSNHLGYSVGYGYGMMSASNVAFNWLGNPAEIDSATNFDFLCAYLTGAWKSNLSIEVEGFNGAKEMYDTIVVASATNPALFTFNYLNINRLYFNSFGGEPAFGPNDGNNFVMDNSVFEFIPEPSTFLLAALGVVSLVAFVRRKRT